MKETFSWPTDANEFAGCGTERRTTFGAACPVVVEAGTVAGTVAGTEAAPCRSDTTGDDSSNQLYRMLKSSKTPTLRKRPSIKADTMIRMSCQKCERTDMPFRAIFKCYFIFLLYHFPLA
jgi:hypothetical protein